MITCVSVLPLVVTTAAAPAAVTPKNVCRAAEARHASTATCTSPSVPFLNPTGMDRPEASWRWTWLSVVRAPIAPQVGRAFPVRCRRLIALRQFDFDASSAGSWGCSLCGELTSDRGDLTAIHRGGLRRGC